MLSLKDHKQVRFPKEEDFIVLGEESAPYMSKWEFFAVLSLAEIPNFKANVDWIAKRLGSTTERIRPILEILIHYQLILKVNGKYCASKKQITAPTGYSPHALKTVHEEYIQKSIETLWSSSKSIKDISGVTIAIHEDKLPEAIRRIKDFRRTLSYYLHGDGESPLNQVYRLNIQLYSLTPSIEKKK